MSSRSKQVFLTMAAAALLLFSGAGAAAKHRHGHRLPRDADSRPLASMENSTLCAYQVVRWPPKSGQWPSSLTEVVCRNPGEACGLGDYRCVQLTTVVNVTSLDTGVATPVSLRYACACGLPAAGRVHQPTLPDVS